MTPASVFERQPAFKRDRERVRQVADLNDIRAVLPPQQKRAAACVWTASLDERAVPHAMRALDEMPDEDRFAVFSQSRAMR